MTGLSHGANLAIGTKLPWSRYRSLMDVGTAQGDLVVQLALAHPHITGIGVDLPEVGLIFEEYASQHGVGGRVRFVAGDLFADPLPAVTWS